ncbi:YecA family protein [Halanaerobaculum tunisiense]
MAKVGRNDACPCGSGKKYKKCCLPQERTQRLYNNAKQKLTREAINFSKKFKQETRELKKEYRKLMNYGRSKELAQGEQANLTNIILFDYPVQKDKTVMELFATTNKEQLRRREEKVLQELLDLNLSVYEVIAVNQDGYHLQDLIQEESYLVAKTDMVTEMANEDDIIFTRVAQINDQYQIVGTLGKVINQFKEQIMNIINHLQTAYKSTTSQPTTKEFLSKYSLYLAIIPSKIKQLKLRNNSDEDYDKQIIDLLADYIPDNTEEVTIESNNLHNSLASVKNKLDLKLNNLDATDEIEETLTEIMNRKFSSLQVQFSIALWRKFKESIDSVRGQAPSWAAGLEYLTNRLLEDGLTQGDVANRYKVSASTVARKYKDISNQLQIEV